MKTETAKCSVCHKLFERSTRAEERYISCPAHSFGETVDQFAYEGLEPNDL